MAVYFGGGVRIIFVEARRQSVSDSRHPDKSVRAGKENRLISGDRSAQPSDLKEVFEIVDRAVQLVVEPDDILGLAVPFPVVLGEVEIDGGMVVVDHLYPVPGKELLLDHTLGARHKIAVSGGGPKCEEHSRTVEILLVKSGNNPLVSLKIHFRV